MSAEPLLPAFEPYTVEGVGTVVAHEGDTYVVTVANGSTYGYRAPSGTPDQSTAAADIAAAIANPPTFPPAPDANPIGARLALAASFSHEEIATSSGGTLLGIIPAGWAMVDFQARVDTAFDTGRTISVGTAASPSRWVNALAVSTVGLKQATPLQLYPQSVANATSVYLKKSAATTVGDIINVTALIERKY